MTDMSTSLYPGWSGPKVQLPSWVVQYGLSKNIRFVQRVYASAPIWQQAELDGLQNVAPIIVCFNAEPRQIKRLLGSEIWKSIHHAKLKTNVDRLVLKMLGGWSFDEAMLFPVTERRRAKFYLKSSKSAVLLACHLCAKGGDLRAYFIMASDVQRMGGTLDLSWGRKRLKREHDALVVKGMMASCDDTPWAKSWFCDVGSYSFSLLKSEAELAVEGATQRHCVRSYARGCREGREVVLRILGPERATCSWRAGNSHIQVKGFANSAVSKSCIQAAKEARRAYQAEQRRARK